MAFISELLGKPITDIDGKAAGSLKDLIAVTVTNIPHPMIEAILVEHKGETFALPYSKVAALLPSVIPLKQRLEDIEPYQPGEQDIYLVRDVLDKQIIDTDGARVVRVNDLELVRVNGSMYVGNVDIGSTGILRRIGLGKAAHNLSSRLRVRLPDSFISWDNVELLSYDQSMRLKVPREKIAELHPADVAEILSDLGHLDSGQFLEGLDVEQLADTLEEVEPEYQASLVEDMSDERVADVLEEMEPDEAADLLAELPKERSEDLLALMEEEDAQDVRKLLAFPEDSAGGIMTTEYAAVPPDLTAEQAIQYLRENGNEAETIFYVYVTDADGKLAGVFSLSRLIFAHPDRRVADFMIKRVVSVNVLDRQNDVAQTIAKYDLLAVPVVDNEEHLQGIVTADDALDKIIPTSWKKRLPRYYR